MQTTPKTESTNTANKVNKKRSFMHLSSLLITDWPATKKVIENLKNLIDSLNSSDHSDAMDQILEKSLTAYGKYVHFDNHKNEDLLRLSVFLDVLITETFSLLNFELINSSSNELVWSSNSKTSFALWRIAYESNQLWLIQRHLISGNNEFLKDSLYRLIVCDQLKNLLKDSDYEAAIVGSRTHTLS